MAGNDLTGDSCGTQNPLIRLSSHLTQDATLKETYGLAGASALAPDAPTTFQMNELLQNIDGLHLPPTEAKSQSMVPSEPWQSEFEGAHASRRAYSHNPADIRSGDVYPSPDVMHLKAQMLFRHQTLGPSTMPQNEETWASKILSQHDQVILNKDQIGEGISVAQNEDQALKEAAQDLIRDIGDDEMQGTSFMKYVRDLAGSANELDENYRDMQELDEGLQELRERTVDYDDEVAFWQGLEETYQRHFLGENAGVAPVIVMKSADRYNFSKTNEHLKDDDPFTQGLSYLKDGNIPEAVLCFEAAAQKEPERAEVWERLGLVLAENEQELDAITACQACLEIQPNNGDALLSLARSFTNEMLNRDACLALKNWLKTQPQYAQLFRKESLENINLFEDVNSQPFGSFGRMRSYVGKEEFDDTEALLLKAVRLNPAVIDPNLQIALGILYNVSGDYSKAVDCFETALKVRDDDPLLWNKLGATLANSHRSEVAVGAYQRALELAPGFVRARSNLSIACIEMGAYWEAIEQGLIAINLQAKSSSKSQAQISSQLPADSIWSLMRIAVMRMDSDKRLATSGADGQGAAASVSRQELLTLISDKNISRLNDIFAIFS